MAACGHPITVQKVLTPIFLGFERIARWTYARRERSAAGRGPRRSLDAASPLALAELRVALDSSAAAPVLVRAAGRFDQPRRVLHGGPARSPAAAARTCCASATRPSDATSGRSRAGSGARPTLREGARRPERAAAQRALPATTATRGAARQHDSRPPARQQAAIGLDRARSQRRGRRSRGRALRACRRLEQEPAPVQAEHEERAADRDRVTAPRARGCPCASASNLAPVW
jgi:hypothetical protein